MILGYFVNFPAMSLIGALMLFGLGLTMLNVDVEVKTGELTNITYNANNTATSLQSSYSYETYDFGTLGQSSYSFMIMIIGALLFVLFIFRLGD